MLRAYDQLGYNFVINYEAVDGTPGARACNMILASNMRDVWSPTTV